MLADEVENQASLLLRVQPQPATELLKEQRRARSRAKQKHRVDEREIDALVVKVAGEEHVHFAGFERARGARPVFIGALAMHRGRGDAQLTELASHEVRVRDGYAESERAHAAQAIAAHAAPKLSRDHLGAPVIPCVKALQILDGV